MNRDRTLAGSSTDRWLVADLDGTLTILDHRIKLAEAKDWDAYHAAGIHDPVRPGAREMLWAWHRPEQGRRVMILTARMEKFRRQTIQWLEREQVPFDALLMRPPANTQDSTVLKPAQLFQRLGFAQVAFVLEDRDKLVAKWRSLGLACFQVSPDPGY